MENSPADAARHRRRRLIALALGVLALAVAVEAAWLVPPERWAQAREFIGRVVAWVRALGPGWFFAAFAVLPAAGFPVSLFALAAGPLFGASLGLPTVLALTGLSMAVSMTLPYAPARYLLRPWAARLLAYLGYRIPEVAAGRARFFTLLVRITPGPPYVLQNLLLGVVGVPFRTYLLVSWPICTANVTLAAIFGDALAQGRGRVALFALAGVVLVGAAVHFARRRLAARAARVEEGAE